MKERQIKKKKTNRQRGIYKKKPNRQRGNHIKKKKQTDRRKERHVVKVS